ncbi:hypothetical protein DFQ28_002246 [Apophysomyces sp. BC1034]|nr:hypothetical protein DFQ30_002814 [Apophysomyces sp. BC1015]KAG0179757.1 hypothetical protein DFQ29_001700 [Apophysomyces sp. BC1021]KAG0190296.1 hypothetical protein DFQ28_002246 [Apophysomyces sp. BC1034]
MSKAIAILQDDLPRFFSHGLAEHGIYANQIVLSDPHYTHLSIHGRTAYLGIAQMLRWSLGLYFDDILFEIVRMRVLPDRKNLEEEDEEDPQMWMKVPYSPLRDVYASKGVVRHLEIRWRLEGTCRPSLIWGRLLGLQSARPVRHVEGVFLYTFDTHGFIGEHRIQRIVPPPSRRVLLLHSFGGRLRAYWEALKQRREPELSPGMGI